MWQVSNATTRVLLAGAVGPTDVFSDHAFNLFLLETTFDDESSTPVNRAAGTQFGKQIGSEMVLGSFHALADIGNVGKNRLPVAFAHTLGRRNLEALAASESMIRVLLRQLVEKALQKHAVAKILGLIVCPDAGAKVHVSGHLLGGASCLFRVLDLELLQLGGEVIFLGRVLLDLLLLLFLQETQVETSIVGRRRIIGSGGG